MKQDAIDHDRAYRAGAALGKVPRLRRVGWCGTIFQLAGAAAMAARITDPWSAYLLMLSGSALWLGVALSRRDVPLYAQMGGFVILNIVGMLRWAA